MELVKEIVPTTEVVGVGRSWIFQLRHYKYSHPRLYPSAISDRTKTPILCLRSRKLPPNPQGFFVQSISLSPFGKKRPNKKLFTGKFTCKMADYETKAVTTDASGNMVYEPILEDGVFRFDCTASDRDAAYPSLSFVNSKARDTPIKNHNVGDPTYIPAFKCHLGQQHVNFLLVPPLYGTGEVGGQLERTGKKVFTWNTDAWGYGAGTTSLYQSHPWVLAVLPTGEALGILADTTRRCEIDLRNESIIQFIASSPYPVITFGPFASPNAVLISLSHAIGTVFMPPKWALGYHQCRWSYESESRVRELTRTFREKGIPCDERFPDPNSLVKDIHDNGFKAIWMLDPGIKQEDGYSVYESGSKDDVWIKKQDGSPFIGLARTCVFPDYTQEKVRMWWANLVKDFISNGVDGIWNDMNEPAVFKVVTKTMPESNVHRGDDELGGCESHSHYHNVYGMLMARSTNEGMKLANPNKRPFVLTRAGFIGSQRYAATWTGDNLSNWEHLHMSVSMVLQLGLSGQPLSGPDIGGFAGNATPRLFGKALCSLSAVGTPKWAPLTMSHGLLACEEVCRLALIRRYRLLPHIYTLFYMAHTIGTPVASPTFFADTKDPSLRKVENSFSAWPTSSLTVPDRQTDNIQFTLPKGIWLSFDFDDSHPALYLQGGAIIPFGPPHQHVGEASPSDDLSLIGKLKVFYMKMMTNGYEFTEGQFLLTHYVAELQSSVVTIRVSKTEGSWKRPSRRLHVDAWGTDGEVVQIIMPPEQKVAELVSASMERYKIQLENAKQVPDVENVPGRKGIELSSTPIELKGGDWVIQAVPWIGGRIISMMNIPSGIQWLHSRVEVNGYEERDLEHAGEQESLLLEGDIGGGLVMKRKIYIPKDEPEVFRIDSSIVAQNVGAGSGGFSRLVCIRVHPMFTLLHPSESYVSFTSIDGSKHEIWPESGEQFYEGDLLPNGEWMLIDKCLGVALVNHFDINEVYKCLIHWGTGTVNLELWSEQRPVSKESPLKISHTYKVIVIP
ncbi:hypothetical protein F8388_022354 [Cannabis sativa]|uniref:Uncharacterized protein n=1 Tax=Cannabis sativa TaxID=3483 RepID=A0A7J6G6B1_CANSA|nr:hypothetical protein F8388_022354 [Cannabis sativa]